MGRIILASILFIASIWFLRLISKFYKTRKRQYLLENDICPYCVRPFQKCVVWDNNQWEASLMCPDLHCGLIFTATSQRTMRPFNTNDPTSLPEVLDYSISKMKYKFLDGFGKPMEIKEILWT